MEIERPSASNGDEASVGTSGLTPLDEERARSMADEGGVSAAAVEAHLPGWRGASWSRAGWQ
jgi:hypothetical protein